MPGNRDATPPDRITALGVTVQSLKSHIIHMNDFRDDCEMLITGRAGRAREIRMSTQGFAQYGVDKISHAKAVTREKNSFLIEFQCTIFWLFDLLAA